MSYYISASYRKVIPPITVQTQINTQIQYTHMFIDNIKPKHFIDNPHGIPILRCLINCTLYPVQAEIFAIERKKERE